jgi:hypothetical protein
MSLAWSGWAGDCGGSFDAEAAGELVAQGAVLGPQPVEQPGRRGLMWWLGDDRAFELSVVLVRDGPAAVRAA